MYYNIPFNNDIQNSKITNSVFLNTQTIYTTGKPLSIISERAMKNKHECREVIYVGDVQGPEKVTILACKQCMQE
jgi:hypothetical protein